jgi:hypothetical protein
MVSHEIYAILHDAVDNDVFVKLSRFCLVDYLFCLQQLLHKRVKGTLYIFFVNFAENYFVKVGHLSDIQCVQNSKEV